MDWHAACIVLRVAGIVLVFSSCVGLKFAQSSLWETRADTWRNVFNPADQKRVRKTEVSNTPHAANIIIQTQSRINHEKYTIYLIIAAPKKPGIVLYLGLKLTMPVVKSQIHLARQSL